MATSPSRQILAKLAEIGRELQELRAAAREHAAELRRLAGAVERAERGPPPAAADPR